MSQQKPSKVQFIQHSLPAFEAGEYILSISQEVSAAGSSPLSNELRFAVSGERFQLKKNEVIKVFPPSSTTGEYANVLPHIMLRRKTLPWERDIKTPSSSGTLKNRVDPGIPEGAKGKQTYKDVASWLAMLVIDQNDPPFAKPGDTAGAARKGILNDLFNTPTNTVSYFTKAKTLQPTVQLADLLDYGENASDPCMYIDVPVDLFKKIIPTGEDLKWLAHDQIAVFPDGTTDAEAAIVMANRLPKAGSMSTAHLVSLEGMGDYLPDKSGNATFPAGTQYVRLASLHSWTFNAVEVKIHFAAYLEHLNKELGQGAAGLIPGLLRRPLKTTPANATVKTLLEKGFLPFAHHTRSNDQLVSWYRGPLVPQSPDLSVSFEPTNAFHLPAQSADALSIFDPASGMFTVSYSAAWQLGRLLALSSKQFATDLYQWKTELVYQTIQNATKQNKLPAKTDRKVYYPKLTALLTDTGQIKSLYPTPPVLPDKLTGWLTDLLLLKSVSFHYLVPDEGMLPSESMKFFQLDRNWLYCLFDGAMSIGRATQSQLAHDRAFLQAYLNQVLGLAGIAADANQTVSGLLLRSAAVKGWWPGIQADGFTSNVDLPDSRTQLPRIRLDTLAPEVMIALFNGAVKRVNIHEAALGTHFGVSPMSNAGQYQKELRFISGSFLQPDQKAPNAGQQLLKKDGNDDNPVVTDPVALLSPGRDALAISNLAAHLKKELIKNNALKSGDLFTAAEFALEMVEGVEEVGFRLGSK